VRIPSHKVSVLIAGIVVMGCSSTDTPSAPPGSSAGGETSASGGATSTLAGAPGTGGAQGNATGGSSSPATGGKLGTGGAVDATGGKATGGNATGGNATGGSPPATGGMVVATGGSNVGTGGMMGPTGGTKTGTGGASTAAGGKTGTGGASTAVGGKTGTGGASTAVGGGSSTPITSTCTEAQKTLNANATGKYCGLNYEYWSDGGSATMIMKPGGFSVNFSVPNNNFLGRMGVRPGTGNEIFTYQATYAPKGNSYLAIYGWTRNPLVEYYIVESYGTYNPSSGATKKGSATCDGGTYTLASNSRTGPSIDGNTTFQQYWAVRDTKHTSGDIDIKCHFDAWKAAGMNMGSLYEITMVVEGYHSSETADVMLSIK
jgi:endo-1,4-beta-xylanase